MHIDISSEPKTESEKKLVQEQFNVNVAFYVHIKTFELDVRDQIFQRIDHVFYFLRGAHWKFDSFGIEKAGSRKNDILCYFIMRDSDVEKLQKQFVKQFEDYANVVKISCSIAKYEKKEENFFELDF